jgi:hypothetical protein
MLAVPNIQSHGSRHMHILVELEVAEVGRRVKPYRCKKKRLDELDGLFGIENITISEVVKELVMQHDI